jgi:hypothetical protein
MRVNASRSALLKDLRRAYSVSSNENFVYSKTDSYSRLVVPNDDFGIIVFRYSGMLSEM